MQIPCTKVLVLLCVVHGLNNIMLICTLAGDGGMTLAIFEAAASGLRC